MKSGFEGGFTIIEVMLFLAITGILFAGLMVGVGSNIARQNYSDSVRSYKALLQDQYSEATNIRQDEDGGTGECTAGTVPTGNTPSRTTIRGASDCIILGRIIEVINNGTGVMVSSVTGSDIVNPGTSEGDIAALVGSEPKRSSIGKQTIQLDAGIALKTALNTGPSSYSKATVLILRSPVSGLMKIFVADNAPGSLKDMITIDNQKLLQNCVTGAVGSSTQVMTINPRIAGADSFVTGDAPAGVCS